MPKPSFLAAEQRVKEANKGKPHGNTLYCILPFADVTQELIDIACETSFETLRHTVIGEDKVFVKFNVEKKDIIKAVAPEEVSNLIKNFAWFTNEEIYSELEKAEWVSDDLV